jgi:hydroxyacylglutathione hydrolase
VGIVEKMLIEGIPLWVAQTNCWIVAPQGPGGEAVLIDAPPEPRAIVERLKEHDLKLVAIFNTHGHLDHIGGVGSLVHGTENGHQIDVRINRHDRGMLEDPIAYGRQLAAYLEDCDMRPPEIIGEMDDGDQIKGAGMTFTCLHTPGHTPGSVCMTLDVDGEAPVLFSGDQLFAGSIGRTDLPGGSYEQLMQSMLSKVMPLTDETQVLPGHGPITTVGRERATNPFLMELRQERRRFE